jgi:hypothetical protein
VEHFVMIGNEGPIFCIFPPNGRQTLLDLSGHAGLIDSDASRIAD